MSSDKAQIPVADDDISHCTILQTPLCGWGYQVALAHNGLQASERIHQQASDLVLYDTRVAEMDGIATLKEIKAYNPVIPVLIMTAFPSAGMVVEAIKSGALDYLVKPLDFDTLQQMLVQALAYTQQSESDPSVATDSRWGIIGDSLAMRALINNIMLVAPSDAMVLICDELGIGKELAVRAIYACSERREKPLVTLNYVMLNESLLESESFGHKKRAFTGADWRREGCFVEADDGTLFPDEIGDIPPLMQVCLLRAIQEREVQCVGSNQTFVVDARSIVAIHRNLAEEVDAGHFHQDPYYRLNVVIINMLPPRQRREDIPLLTQHFLKRYAGRSRKVVQGFTPQAMDLPIHYPWPGNIRELENAVERVMVLLAGNYISERESPLVIVGTPPLPGGSENALAQPLVEAGKEVTLAVLEKTGDSKTEVVRQLGITRKTPLAELSR